MRSAFVMSILSLISAAAEKGFFGYKTVRSLILRLSNFTVRRQGKIIPSV